MSFVFGVGQTLQRNLPEQAAPQPDQRVRLTWVAQVLNYRDNHDEPPYYLRKILENDLFGAVGAAAPPFKQCILDIADYINANLPENIYRSPEAVAAHLGE